jgi:hypothetical protein
MRRAVANILCGRHNWALSPFDAEAAKLSAFLRENIHDDPLAAASVRLNGAMLEKWALKTFFNLGYVCGLNREQSNPIDPPAPPRAPPIPRRAGRRCVGLYFITGQGIQRHQHDQRRLVEPPFMSGASAPPPYTA